MNDEATRDAGPAAAAGRVAATPGAVPQAPGGPAPASVADALRAELQAAREAASRANARAERAEARLAFQLELNARLRPLADPQAIQHEAARALGAWLGASRVGFAEDCGDDEHVLIGRHYTDGVPPVEGRFRYADYDPELLRALRGGRPVLRADVSSDPVHVEATRAARAALHAGSAVSVPLTKDGRVLAVMFVHHRDPREWPPEELALVEALGVRIWDAVQRARAEAALRESESKYRSLFDSIDEGFVIAQMIWDGGRAVDCLVVEANPAQRRITGLDDVVGRRIRQIVPGIGPEWVERFERVARTGESMRVESRIERTDRWFEVHAFRADPRSGERVAIVFGDITARKHAETTLRESAARQAFLLALGDALRTLTDPRALKAAAARILGEQLGVAAAGYVEVEIDEETVFADGEYGDGRLPARRGWHRLSDYGAAFSDVLRAGQELCVEDVDGDAAVPFGGPPAAHALGVRAVAAFPLLKDGRLIGLFHAMHHEPRRWRSGEREMLREVAERTWEAIERARAEAGLRASEARYRTLVENVRGYAIFMTDAAGHVTEWTEGAARVMGYGAREAIGRPVSIFCTPEDIAAGEPERALAQAARAGRAEREGWRVRKGGARIWVNEITTAVHGPDGALAGFTKIARDLTVRRRTEEALQAADRRKDEFLATLAHELRNPLAPLRNGLHIARLTSHGDPTLARTVDMMDRQLTHLVRLVDDLLDIGRISAGKMELRRRAVALGDVLASSVEAARVAVESQGHALVVDIAPGTRSVLGDFDRLAQVFTNLLTNAAKYTEPGGRIRLSLAHEGDDEVVRVEDSGIGIPPDELARVFDLFSQVRSHQGRSTGGLGIGLSLVRTIVGLHGGSVDASSPGAGRGSTFCVRLPVAAPATASAAIADDPAQAKRARGRRVLVVDDNVDAARSLSELLELMGHRTWLAHDGDEAIEVAHAVAPELVLLDLGMPRMNGIEAAKRMRALPDAAGMRIAALTGWGQESDRARTGEAGFDWHLVKPVDVAVLADLFDRLPDPGGTGSAPTPDGPAPRDADR